MFPNAKGSELLSVLATIDPASQAAGAASTGWVPIANYFQPNRLSLEFCFVIYLNYPFKTLQDVSSIKFSSLRRRSPLQGSTIK